MRKIIFQNLITLDGYFEGPHQEIDWHNVDAEYNDYAIGLLNRIDTILFGRVTYELMANYWPTESARKDDPIVAAAMNKTKKLVASRTLKSVEWENTELIHGDLTTEIKHLKQQLGKDIAVLGSSSMTVTLLENDLIDEFHLMLNPLILGGGKTLFSGLNHRYPLTLVETRTFKNGNVLLIYNPIRKEN